MEKDLLSHHSVTLNSLLAEQQALNMRMLLAVQLRDEEAQETLRRELEEIALKIEQFLEGQPPVSAQGRRYQADLRSAFFRVRAKRRRDSFAYPLPQ